MTSATHVDSYYASSANPAPEHPRVQGTVECDVCVIGAGLTGTSAALELAGRGYDTVMLEAHRVGWGASGRSGGQTIFGYACEQAKIRKMVGKEDDRRLWDMSVEAMMLLKDRIAKYEIDCDYKPGHMHAAIKPRQHRELLEWQREMEDDYGYSSLRMVDRDELASLMATGRYMSGLLDEASGHLHPLNYTLGLNAAAREAGAKVHENSPVLALEEIGEHILVKTPEGEVRCRFVLLCGNAYLGDLSEPIRTKVMPVGTYIVATERLDEELATSLIRNDMAVADINFVLDYFRLSADRRMLFGGRVSYSTIPPPSLSHSIRARMTKVYPQLKDMRIEYAWGGNVAITMNRAPHFGRLSDKVFYAQGFSGHGMVLTGFAGKLLAEAVAGSAERLDVFSRIPHHPFPGGRLFRTPALVLAMAYYRIRDLL
ncbi:MAG: FAD-binding oxidoreductase [Gammaproteobacteria bacterium]|nr:MAG: FAD-binding oxidoreductase [Gammaproteobacteria bacterium]